MRHQDPRTHYGYIRMDGVVDFLESYGPHTIEDLCLQLGMSAYDFRAARYSLSGRMALEDRGVTIPRPVSTDGYMYKLSTTFRSGVGDDAEPGTLAAFSDVLTRQATVYVDVEKMVSTVPPGPTRKLLRKLLKSMDAALDRMEDVAVNSGAPIGSWAQSVLDRI